jgi:hypothetical protein
MGCETACTAQLLYMAGRLDPDFDQRALNRRIGRADGAADMTGGNLRVLLEEGFQITSISDSDLERIVADPAYVRAGWLEDGDTEDEVDEAMRTVYPAVRRRAERKLDAIRRHPRQFQRVPRRPAWTDVTQLVDAGWCVAAERPTSAGLSHRVLIIRRKRSRFLLFDPTCGLSWTNVNQLAGKLLVSDGVEAYRLPGEA